MTHTQRATCVALALAALLALVPTRVAAQESRPRDEASVVRVDEDAPHTLSELDRWVGKLRQGGYVIAAQLVLSVLALAFVLERAFMLRRSSMVPAGVADRARVLWREEKFGELVAMGEGRCSTLERVIATLAEHRRAPMADLSATAGDIASRDVRRHLSRAYPIAVIATIQPLLGLLGTVSGMVDAFDAVSVAGLGKVEVLGSSISKALMTTMVGLAIAIPLLLAYHYFKNRTQVLGYTLEEELTDLITEWKLKDEA